MFSWTAVSQNRPNTAGTGSLDSNCRLSPAQPGTLCTHQSGSGVEPSRTHRVPLYLKLKSVIGLTSDQMIGLKVTLEN